MATQVNLVQHFMIGYIFSAILRASFQYTTIPEPPNPELVNKVQYENTVEKKVCNVMKQYKQCFKQ